MSLTSLLLRSHYNINLSRKFIIWWSFMIKLNRQKHNKYEEIDWCIIGAILQWCIWFVQPSMQTASIWFIVDIRLKIKKYLAYNSYMASVYTLLLRFRNKYKIIGTNRLHYTIRYNINSWTNAIIRYKSTVFF